ncbi:MAG: cystathionine gamma-synthase [Naasia sp.]|jgi:cystathionine gamma-synthase|uniref:trans-sulfuration enzyme family protein n=1 Tax=Naasia sp. TaxID=2546198 RepID=UPI00260C6550|nr:PLP-dependent aspartate aminotransferase family protein [Naasia sp.]MCU1570807.1 cystathionine gamma-synthase [Naasia sp.]
MTESLPDLHPDTIAVTAGRPANEPDQPLNPPIVLASTYVAGGEMEYGRYGNPTWSAFEEALGALEGGRCLAFASGVAATAAVLDLVPQGGRVVVPRHSYQGTLAQLRHAEEQGRVVVARVDVADTAAVIDALDGAALVWIENPTNPALELAEVTAIASAAHGRGVLVAADNTFATPILRQPLDEGADIVVHSATKGISGHSDVLMGAVLTRDESLFGRLLKHRSLYGAIPSPLDAYLALRGLRTLPLRLERAQENAQELVRRLGDHAAVRDLRYPGFGTILSIVLQDAAVADVFVASVRLCRHATSLGGVETTLERRRRWAGEAPTIAEGLVRVSVGVEHIEDLARDLTQALDAAEGDHRV